LDNRPVRRLKGIDLPILAASNLRPGVIWISGYSGAGKTTVGRSLHLLLQHEFPEGRCIFLDGDDLRSILGGGWGYERAERIRLARVYFRLCSHLAAQGMTVIISAVAMYDEVRAWFHSNLVGIEVYLDVPEAELRRRDASTKRLYGGQIGALGELYDPAMAPDLSIRNYGEAAPEAVAREILRCYNAAASHGFRDAGRTEHWRNFYRRNVAPQEPSSFAHQVLGECGSGSRLLEVGAGNGRDAFFFSAAGLDVTAIDTSDAAIELCRKTHPETHHLKFFCGSLASLSDTIGCDFDVIYSRFCLHAMTMEEEIETLRAAGCALRRGGLLFIECRSINDPLARMGEVISPTERIHGHYRRFVVLENLVENVEMAGFSIRDAGESDDIAVLGDDNPVVIRLTAQRR
jgi:adenylylsulfate kinase-like enzyme/SAM-dependent methyltransferase